MSRKDREQSYLQNFLELSGEKPTQIEDGEAPDFIVDLRGKKIGVEITEYHSSLKGIDGKPRRAIEESLDSLYKTLKRETSKYSELRGIDGYLDSKDMILIPKREHREVVNEIIQLTLERTRRADKGWKSIEIEVNPQKSRLLGKYSVEKIRLYNTGCRYPIKWGGVDASFIGLEEAELIDSIRGKISKAKNYRKEALNELWLLIVSTFRLSQGMPSEDLRYKLKGFDRLNNLLKNSGYDKVYLYQSNFAIIYEWPGWIKFGELNFLME